MSWLRRVFHKQEPQSRPEPVYNELSVARVRLKEHLTAADEAIRKAMIEADRVPIHHLPRPK